MADVSTCVYHLLPKPPVNVILGSIWILTTKTVLRVSFVFHQCCIATKVQDSDVLKLYSVSCTFEYCNSFHCVTSAPNMQDKLGEHAT